METFAKLFERFLVFVYHCFDRIVIQGGVCGWSVGGLVGGCISWARKSRD